MLENHHVALAFGLAAQEGCEWMEALSAEEKKELRETMCHMVLGTEMRAHFELLARFKLDAKREDLAGTLSGGQRKLLEMARALMVGPELVCLDEPMAGVNPALVQSLLGHVKSLRDELGMTVVFVERKARADEIMTLLNEEGVAAAAFHGGRSQQEREAALSDFTTGKCAVLVATDVAARGLDVKGVMHVVNLDLPRMFEDYVHRVGRTGRAGMTGRATSFYTDRDSFLVAQIKRALQDLENGNAFAFATGKEARAKEREAQKAWREGRAAEPEQAAVGGVDIIVDDKFKHMKLSASTASLTSAGGAGAAAPAGNADDAFGSDDDDDW